MLIGPMKLGTRERSPNQDLKLEDRLRNVTDGKTYLCKLNVCALEAITETERRSCWHTMHRHRWISYLGFVELSRHKKAR